MNKLKNMIVKLGGCVASLALAIGLSTVTSACYFWYNQPEMPEEIKNYRKDN